MASAELPTASAALPLASSAALASASSPSGLRPFTAGFLSDGAANQHPDRAWLLRPSSARIHRGDPSPFPQASARFTPPSRVIVIEQQPQDIRFVIDKVDVRLLLWARRDGFEPVPTRPTRVAVKKGIYPDGPASVEGRDQLGLWLAPGWRGEVVSSEGGWSKIKVTDSTVEASGWLDESLLGVVFRPEEQPSIRAHSRVYSGAPLLAAPGGAPIGHLIAEPVPVLVPWFEEVGKAPAGFHQVQYIGPLWWIRALVAAPFYRPVEFGTGYGRGTSGTSTVVRRLTRPRSVEAIEPGAELLDQADGEVVGRTRQLTLIPERADPTRASGRRLVEIYADDLGIIPLWVDETKIHDYQPPPPASAARPATSAPRP